MTLPPAPGEDHMDHIKKLTQKSGKEFDKDYVNMMIDDHESTIKKFEEASNDGKRCRYKGFCC